MKRGSVFCLGICFLMASCAVTTPLQAEDTPTVSSAEETFQPESAQEGFAEIESFLRDPENSLPITERLPKALAMHDVVWKLDSDPEFKRKLIWMRFSLRMAQARTGDESGIDALMADLKSYSQQANPEVALEAQDAMMTLEMMLIRDKSAEKREAYAHEKLDEIEAMEVAPNSAKLAMTLARNLTTLVEDAEAAKIADELSRHFASSEDPKLQKASEDLKGFSRRINLNGNKMRVVGKTLDGQELQWDSYQGKVVLVDFWATWCGPCVGEFPHMKEMYEAYHPHGFEIVGISLDDTKSDVEQFITDRKIPWTIVCNAEGENYRGFSDENARYYGINAIPQMIFVGKDGIVQATDARGDKLALLLAQAFPDVKAPKFEEEDEAPLSKQK